MKIHSTGGLATVLREELVGCGESAYAVAKRARIGMPAIYAFRNGRRSLSLPAAGRLMRALGLKVVKDKARG